MNFKYRFVHVSLEGAISVTNCVAVILFQDIVVEPKICNVLSVA